MARTHPTDWTARRAAAALATLALTACVVVLPARARAATAPPTGANVPISLRLLSAGNPWNADISALPVDARSEAYLTSMGMDTEIHPDFGTVWNGAPNGIPYVVVRGTQPKVPISFYYADESDPGPYPIPRNAPVEGGPASDGDRHILTLDVDNHLLYEVYDAHYNATAARWEAGSGAVWDLDANAIRPEGWTSPDAAGLPMLPGLVRYDEVSRGAITHALRFTVERTQRAYRYPASHFADDETDADLPPMGLRVRLKAGYDISGFPAHVQVILRALKRYGMIVADDGGPWYISGAPDPRWDDDALHAITQVRGGDFEVVDTRGIEPAAPLVSAGRGAQYRRGRTLKRWGCFADTRGSRWTATVDYDDGRGPVPLALVDGKRFRLSKTLSQATVHHMVVRVRNELGVTGSYRLRVVVR